MLWFVDFLVSCFRSPYNLFRKWEDNKIAAVPILSRPISTIVSATVTAIWFDLTKQMVPYMIIAYLAGGWANTQESGIDNENWRLFIIVQGLAFGFLIGVWF